MSTLRIIIKLCPVNRQTMLFSATMTDQVTLVNVNLHIWTFVQRQNTVVVNKKFRFRFVVQLF